MLLLAVQFSMVMPLNPLAGIMAPDLQPVLPPGERAVIKVRDGSCPVPLA